MGFIRHETSGTGQGYRYGDVARNPQMVIFANCANLASDRADEEACAVGLHPGKHRKGICRFINLYGKRFFLNMVNTDFHISIRILRPTAVLKSES
jgi:hypothetical protein